MSIKHLCALSLLLPLLAAPAHKRAYAFDRAMSPPRPAGPVIRRLIRTVQRVRLIGMGRYLAARV